MKKFDVDFMFLSLIIGNKQEGKFLQAYVTCFGKMCLNAWIIFSSSDLLIKA